MTRYWLAIIRDAVLTFFAVLIILCVFIAATSTT